MSSASLRVGVVGLGFGQHAHVPAFRSDPRCEVVALAGSTRERTAVVAARHGIARVCSWQEIVSAPDIDVVSLSVPPHLQPQIALEAIAQGKHVFCEKPVGLTADSARLLRERADAKGVAHAVDFELRASPAWRRAKSAIERGSLGSIKTVAVSWRVATQAFRNNLGTWKSRDADGGGALYNFGSHSVDAVLWLAGPARKVAAWLPGSSTGDWRAELWLELVDGAQATVSIANDALFGPGHSVAVYAERGAMFLENSTPDTIRGFTLHLGAAGSSALERIECDPLPPEGDGRIHAVTLLVREFVDGIVSGKVNHPNLEDGLRVAEVIDAAHRASRSGTWQTP